MMGSNVGIIQERIRKQKAEISHRRWLNGPAENREAISSCFKQRDMISKPNEIPSRNHKGESLVDLE
jgi:hypothetical protein